MHDDTRTSKSLPTWLGSIWLVSSSVHRSTSHNRDYNAAYIIISTHVLAESNSLGLHFLQLKMHIPLHIPCES